ncbi:MAG: DNA-3-methyladenine glycosylase I [Firmicutes bacterium]|jgi:DNA-3-methyladenine glycosylase I|uniref:DNA-3-methyladenine glycosylase I n=1 Tax=Sulfobacillus benefaciens TaxID=453960 RepID=A0A2T2WMF7_9FIRM|nr:DNA-3-methyladenine glycosylase I [Bacillota bacterium]MCL5013445.1 DNA-3-methyladenine glycosylase I [Bacillota bacterium]PSR23425.1 MAG: DNA-3-methyladenine glycosylase I [Sulfobacillus benefaciens]HBQ94742.1 DNA-3-methyladenine glycosylase I [Sulfobacillus sp.]
MEDGSEEGDRALGNCGWATRDPLYQKYHDEEWGVPVTDDSKLLEMLILEGMQAGLSWFTVLKKRDAFRQAFAQFMPLAVANFSSVEIESFLSNPALIRNRLKIESAIRNARAFVQIQREEGSFAAYLWSFVNNVPEIHHYTDPNQILPFSPLAERISHDLKRRGFRFVGPTICYSYCQAVGIVMDHLTHCERYTVLARPRPVKLPH